MNTPAHIVINLLCLGRRDTARILTPVVLGAVIPDAPMFVFYFVEKVIQGTPERIIWSQAYYQPQWQNFIDVFNSLPLAVIGLGIAWRVRSQWGLLLFTSMVLHIAGDLPLHHDDGHRHFFPFSNWRFESPISYWDPNHYGGIMTAMEILVVVVSCGLLVRTYKSLAGKLVLGVIGGCYLSYFVYVLRFWA